MNQNPASKLLDEQIHILTNLMAIVATNGASVLAEKAAILDRAGMSPKQIAEVLGSTPNSISVAISKQKRSKRK